MSTDSVSFITRGRSPSLLFPTNLSTLGIRVAVVTIRAFSFWRCRESGDRTLVGRAHLIPARTFSAWLMQRNSARREACLGHRVRPPKA